MNKTLSFVPTFGTELVLLLLTFLCNITTAQNVSGIFNDYAVATAFPEQCKMVVDSAQFFQEGDQVLVIQMKGAEIDLSNTASYGDITTYANAGNYEVAEVSHVFGDTLFFKYELIHPYDPQHKVQVINSKQYKSVRVTNTLIAPAWDGERGGVIFIYVSDTINIQAKLDVEGKGYRGGKKSEPNVICNFADYFTGNFRLGAEKGESFVEYPADRWGRGKLAVGGGGGNNHNAGGGGGGNFGSGGIGGKEYSMCTPASISNGGVGGEGIPYGLNLMKAFMGGGGGGGHQNDNASNPRKGMDGKAGGGLVILHANTILGNNQVIDASGLSQDSLSGRDGAGGGGAGGSVLIEADKVIGLMSVKVTGGDGGSLDNNNFNQICHGPGGGGAGGLLWTSSASISANFQLFATPGAAGKIINTNSSCFNTTYGAASGSSGATLTGFTIPTGIQSCPWNNLFIDAENDTVDMYCGVPVYIDVQANDQGGSPFSTSLLTPPVQGSALVTNGDSIQYDCSSNGGIDSLYYVICLDAYPTICDTAVVYINFSGVVANNDVVVAPKGVQIGSNVTGNDILCDQYQTAIYQNGANGTASFFNEDSLVYTPNSGFTGADTILYIVCCLPGNSPCDTAQVVYRIYEVDAVDDYDSTTVGQQVGIEVLNNDRFTFPTSIIIHCPPRNGQAQIGLNSQGVLYTPDPGFSGKDSICYVICNFDLCDTAWVYINVKPIIIPDIVAPSGFSPNGDGINDTWVIKDILLSDDNELIILNRWGQQVYSVVNYKNTWDGRNNGGTELPDGTYFYVLNLNDLNEEHTGYVVIQR